VVVAGRLKVVAGAALALAAAASAQELGGPLGAREEWLLAQPRLSLVPFAADTLAAGRSEVRLRLDWGNDFGWQQDKPGEQPEQRSYLVDGEHRTLDLSLRHGLTRSIELELRVPVEWRGAGSLDRVIDWYHAWSGFPDNGRRFFAIDRYRIEGMDSNGPRLTWRDTGTGLGNVELGTRVRVKGGAGWRATLAGRLALPTGTGPYSGHGVGFGLQLGAARRLGRHFELTAGAGGAAQSATEVDSVRYERLRAHGFGALEWLVSRRWSVLAETTASSRLVTNLAQYSGFQLYLNLGSRFRLDSGWALEAGFTEGIVSQRNTTDFAFQLGLARRFP
jgi:hypothetical protein